MPAEAGIHSHRLVFMDSGLRRNDNEGKAGDPIAGELFYASTPTVPK
jgi:hypothetical protein